uniref:Tetratricopeptide repeat protein n=1 Tax=Gronococcus sybilensis TaxID=3028029 RepID=A0A9Y1I2M0_9RHOD|nr:hypothetical protein GRSY_133 [Gronococcus sybilensis]
MKITLSFIYVSTLLAFLGLFFFLLLKESLKKIRRELRLNRIEVDFEQREISAEKIVHLINMYASRNMYHEIRRELEDFLQKNYQISVEMKIQIYEYLALANYETKLYKYAIEYYQKLLALSPNNTMALDNLSHIYQKLDMLEGQ